MDTKNLWIVEYSPIQEAVHINTLEKALASNRESVLNGIETGYIPIYAHESKDMVDKYAEITMAMRENGIFPSNCAKWELAVDGDGLVCSKCGTDFCTIVHETEKFKYCPNCRAKIDGQPTD